MSNVIELRAAPALSNPAAGLVQRLATPLIRLRAHLATLRELSQLNDRELADIGIHRSRIRDVARDAALRIHR